MPVNRIAAAIACLSILAAQPAVPAEAPYFRFTAGGDGTAVPGTVGQGGALHPDGPSGAYTGRVGRPFATPAPRVAEGASGATWYLGAGPLPGGLSVSASTGAVSGIPGSEGSYGPLAVAVRTPDGRTGTSPSFSIQVMGAPALAYDDLSGSAGSYARATPGTRNLTPGATYTLAAGEMPGGLALDPHTGAVYGAFAQAGTWQGLRVRAVDTDGAEAVSDPFSVTSDAGTASLSASSASVRSNNPLTVPLTPSGLVAPVTYALQEGTLPDGVALDGANARIAGTPTAPGSHPGLVVRARDANGRQAWTKPFSLLVYSPSVGFGDIQASYGAYVEVAPRSTGLGPDARWSLSGALPDGLGFSQASGTVSGTPTAVGGAEGLVATATDALGSYATAPFAVTVSVDSLAVKAGAGAFAMRLGKGFSTTFLAPSASPPVTWTIQSGQLPDGLVLGQDGRVSGVPTQAGTRSAVVGASDKAGRRGSSPSVPFTVYGPPVANAKPAYVAVVGKPFDDAIGSGNVVGSGSFTLTRADLPPGLTVDASGRITGTPTDVGSVNGIVATLTDDYDGATATTQPFSVSAVPPTTAFTVTGTQPAYQARVNRSIRAAAPVALNAPASIRWSLAPGSDPLPAGLSVAPDTGALAGVPTAVASAASVSVLASEVGGTRTAVSKPFRVDVAPELSVAGLQDSYDGKVGTPFAVQPYALGLLRNATWELVGGSLPSGLSLEPSYGTLSGMPLQPGVVPDPSTPPLTGLSLRVVDSFDGAAATSPAFAIRFARGLIVLGPSLLTGRTGTPFDSTGSYTLANGDPRQSRTWSLLSGDLPSGLSLNASTGAIAGVPTTEGTSNGIRLRVTQADGTYGDTPPLSVAIKPSIRVDAAPLQTLHVNAPSSFAPKAVGTQGATTWSVASGSLPPGLAFNPATGKVTGTPTATGSYGGLRFRVADATRATAVSDPMIVVVNGGMTWGNGYDFGPVKRYGSPMRSSAPSVVGAAGKVTYKLDQPLWDWSVDPDTGVLTGSTPRVPNGYTLTYNGSPFVTATDESGATARPGLTNIYGRDDIWFYDCNRDCTRSFTVGRGMVWSTGGWFDVVGVPRFGFAPGTPTYDWLTLDPASGHMRGVPQAVGTYPVTVRLTDTDGRFADAVRTVMVVPDPAPTAADVVFKTRAARKWDGPVALDMTDLPGPYTWASGVGDPAMSFWTGGPNNGQAGFWSWGLNPGFISGSYIEGTASDGTKRRVSVGVDVAGPIDATWNPQSVCLRTGETYRTGDWVASNAHGAPFQVGNRWGDTTNLPTGFSLDPATGRVEGKATGETADNGFTLKIVDPWDGAVAYSQGFTISTRASLGFVLSATSVNVRVNDRLLVDTRPQGLTWQGATYDLAAGSLPKGVTFTNGVVDGYPQESGTFSPTLRMTPRDVCNPNDRPVTATVVMTVTPSLALRYPDMVYLRQGVPSRADAPTAKDPKGPVTWDLACCKSLPPGVSFDNTTGQVYGTATVAGTYPGYVAGGGDGVRYVQTNAFDIVVTPGPSLAMQPSYGLVQGTAASVEPTVANLVGALTWSLSGTPPAGLALDPASGALKGVPTGPQRVDGLVLSVSDAGGGTASSDPFSIVVSAPPPSVSVPALTLAQDGKAFRLDPVAANFAGAPAWSLAGTPPPGVGLDTASGSLVGTPTATGEYTGLTLTATDGAGVATASNAFAIRVSNVPEKPDCPATFGRWRGSYSPGFAGSGYQTAYQSWTCLTDTCAGLPANPSPGLASAGPGGTCASAPGPMPQCLAGDFDGTPSPGQEGCPAPGTDASDPLVLLTPYSVVNINGVEGVNYVLPSGYQVASGGAFPLNVGWFAYAGAPFTLETVTAKVFQYTISGGGSGSATLTRTAPGLRARKSAVDAALAGMSKWTYRDVWGSKDPGVAVLAPNDASAFANAMKAMSNPGTTDARYMYCVGFVCTAITRPR